MGNYDIGYPELVAFMPEQMFVDLREFMDEHHQEGEFSIVDCLGYGDGPRLPCISPVLEAIRVAENVDVIESIHISISSGLVNPNTAQRPNTDFWHADGTPSTSGYHRYITTDVLPTEFKGIFGIPNRPKPRALVRFDNLGHRSPVNKERTPIYRNLIRAVIEV